MAEALSDPPEPGESIAALLRELEALSLSHPDRVLRLRGTLPPPAAPGSVAAAPGEPFELLIFRGFSSLTTHPTAFDPDRAALPEGSGLLSAELLQGPLDPAAEIPLAGPDPVHTYRRDAAWRGGAGPKPL
jgi:hypothetical protein